MTEIKQVPQNSVANGPVAAAVLACGFGCFALGVLAVAGDGSKSIAAALNLYNPTGPLSGVTTVAIALWLVCWVVLAARWRNKSVAFGKVSAVAFLLLALGLLLTFPPFGDLLLGR
jgi:Flp pilus assembly protein protease CpaA